MTKKAKGPIPGQLSLFEDAQDAPGRVSLPGGTRVEGPTAAWHRAWASQPVDYRAALVQDIIRDMDTLRLPPEFFMTGERAFFEARLAHSKTVLRELNERQT